MNLIDGKIVEKESLKIHLKHLPTRIANTLSKPLLSPSVVIHACEQLAKNIPETLIYESLQNLGVPASLIQDGLANFRLLMDSAYLTKRVEIELGKNSEEIWYTADGKVEQRILPLGVLFHVAAGNMDGLPLYTVIEGLLSGNINFLKLPTMRDDPTVFLLKELCEIEPALSKYIYVFEFGKEESASIQALIELSDAVVLWGGDETVSAIRKITPPNTKIIEWGHKLSFAYITKTGIKEKDLEGIARNICLTNQLLCSSCQGIFLDTDDFSEAAHFCEYFFPILENIAAHYPPIPLGARAQNTLILRTRALEKTHGIYSKIYRGKNSCLLLERDQKLSLSMQFRHPWVKCLPHTEIISTLHPNKNHLQSAALLCGNSEQKYLRDSLWRAGVVRITSGEKMMESYCGEPHDGQYPLRMYTRIVSSATEN